MKNNKEKCYNINMITETILNTWNKADKFFEILNCTMEELPDRVLVEEEEKES